MTPSFTVLLVIGVLVAAGVYLMLERRLIRILLGFLLLGNAANLLLLTTAGPPGTPPIRGAEVAGRDTGSDPLSHAMVLTAIVISASVAAFILALAYRSYQTFTSDTVADDSEDSRIARQNVDDLGARPDRDRSDDPHTGAATPAGDDFGSPTREAPFALPDAPPAED